MSGRATAGVRRRRAIAFAVAMVLVASSVLGACGIGTEPQPSRVDPEAVPFGLLDDATTTVVDRGEEVTIHLIADDRLVPVDRRVTDDATLADLLELVVAGPTEEERSLGITTAVPSGAVAAADESRGIARVELAEAFGDVRSEEQLLAIGQIVYTLTERRGLGGVEFLLGGEEVSVPIGEGTVVEGAIARDDLEALAPS